MKTGRGDVCPNGANVNVGQKEWKLAHWDSTQPILPLNRSPHLPPTSPLHHRPPQVAMKIGRGDWSPNGANVNVGQKEWKLTVSGQNVAVWVAVM